MIVAEATGGIGNGVSSRNSEVIHAGMYYPTGSQRAKHCVQGRRMLYEFCASHGVPHKKVGKLIVATDAKQTAKIEGIARQGEINGVEGLELIGANAARAMEPALTCVAALHSPETGIIDSHAFMLALQGDLEDRGGMIAFNTPVERLARTPEGFEVHFGGAEPGALTVDAVINSAGLGAQPIARATEGYSPARVPRLVLAKGNYFGFTGKPVFTRLIYPAPVEGGLGTHVTLDLAGRMRFGPDVEWIDARDLYGRPEARGVVLRERAHLLAGAAGQFAGAGLLRHPPQTHRQGRGRGGLPDRRPGRARRAAARAPVRDRVARPHLGAVDRRGGGRADSIEIGLQRSVFRNVVGRLGRHRCFGRSLGARSRLGGRRARAAQRRALGRGTGHVPWRHASRSAPP